MNDIKLSPDFAKKLSSIYSLIHEVFNQLEDIRPGGGFASYIDEIKYCKCCGAKNEDKI